MLLLKLKLSFGSVHGKLQTYDYFYHMNMGPPDHCVLCGLVLETANHL